MKRYLRPDGIWADRVIVRVGDAEYPADIIVTEVDDNGVEKQAVVQPYIAPGPLIAFEFTQEISPDDWARLTEHVVFSDEPGKA